MRNEKFVRKHVFARQKLPSLAGVSEKWKNLISTSQKTASTRRNKVSLKKVAASKF